jgi:hypothetical protein
MSSRTPVANGRADLSPSFEALNEKLWKNTGTVVASMRLELCNETGTVVRLIIFCITQSSKKG